MAEPSNTPKPSTGVNTEAQKAVDALGQPPKRYVRTFASDKKTLEQGGKPDLAPLSSAQDAPFPQGAPVSPSAGAMPMPVPFDDTITLDEPKETPEQIIARLRGLSAAANAGPPQKVDKPLDLNDTPMPGALDRLVGGSAVKEFDAPPPPPPPQATAPPPPAPVPEELAPLHTYKSDFAGKIQETGASAVSMLAAEADAGGAVSATPEPARTGGAFFIAGGVFLLLIGGVGVYYGLQSFSAKQPVYIAPVISAPIFVDERDELSLGNGTLLSAFLTEVGKPLKADAVRFVYTTGATTTGNDLFTALKLPAPNIVTRNINALGSMAGVIHTDEGQSPFFILAVTSYGDTFSGMLSWEPRMGRDLAQLYPAFPPPAPVAAPVTASSTASTTPAAPVAPVVSLLPFHDEVIANHDARVLRDSANRTIMVYGYWNQNTLVIARSQAAFSELADRLSTSKTQR